ncbi:unnamed protein product, partial [Dovyalis caffra]
MKTTRVVIPDETKDVSKEEEEVEIDKDSTMSFKGPPYTWKRGNLQEHPDRVMYNNDWQITFPNVE